MKADYDGGTIYESPVGLEKYFVGQYGIEPYYNNVVRGRRLKDIIDLHYVLDGSEVVQGMVDGGVVWQAPLVALKKTRSWVDSKRLGLFPNPTPGYGHMDMGDFREVVDYLKNWKREVRNGGRHILIIQRVRERRVPERPIHDGAFFRPCLCVFVLVLGLWGVIWYRGPWSKP